MSFVVADGLVNLEPLRALGQFDGLQHGLVARSGEVP